MKAKFNLINFMKDHREEVIREYNKLQNEKFFNGINLKDFMCQVLNLMQINNPRSEKRACYLLPILTGDVYFDNSRVFGEDKETARLEKKYTGTAFMAMV